MSTIHIESKLIDAVDYDEASKSLKVYLSSGQRREHSDVSPKLVKAMLTASSPGRYYMNEIKGKY